MYSPHARRPPHQILPPLIYGTFAGRRCSFSVSLGLPLQIIQIKFPVASWAKVSEWVEGTALAAWGQNLRSRCASGPSSVKTSVRTASPNSLSPPSYSAAPNTADWMQELRDAMRPRHRAMIVYRKPDDDSKSSRTIEPLG